MDINAKIRKAKNGYILVLSEDPEYPQAPAPFKPTEMVFTALDECMSYIRGFIGE